MSFEILMQFSWTENCYSFVMFISFINITHYLVFKEQNLREIISQNQVNKYKVAN